jgi:hypothetical protein
MLSETDTVIYVNRRCKCTRSKEKKKKLATNTGEIDVKEHLLLRSHVAVALTIGCNVSVYSLGK